MAEKVSVFRPKRNTVEQATISSQERPLLSELTYDEQRVTSIEFYINKILGGDIKSSGELEARLETRAERRSRGSYYYSSSAGYDYILINDRGRKIADSNGNEIKVRPKELVQIGRDEDKRLINLIFDTLQPVETGMPESTQNALGLKFYASKILEGDIKSTDELEARLGRRTEQRQRGYYYTDGYDYFLLDKFGRRILRKGTDLKVRLGELVLVPGEKEKGLIRKLYDSTAQVLNSERESTQNAAGLSFYTNLIISKKIRSVDELEARFDSLTKIETSGYYDRYTYFLVDANGKKVVVNGKEVKLPPKDSLPVPGEDERALLRQIYTLKTESALPTEVESLVYQLFSSLDLSYLNRLRNLVSTEQFGFTFLQDFVRNTTAVAKKLSLERQVYDALFNKTSVPDALATLSTYEQEGVSDVALTERLRNQILNLRRVKIVEQAAGLLVDEETDPKRALDLAGLLAKSSDVEDKQTADTLAKLAYRIETTQYLNGINQRIQSQVSTDEIIEYINSVTVRPGVDGVDILQQRLDLKAGIGRIIILKKVNAIRRSFKNSDIESVLSQIESLPDIEKDEQRIKAQVFSLYQNYLAANNPKAFNDKLVQTIKNQIEANLREDFDFPDLGRNTEAVRYVSKNFGQAIYPLIWSLKSDPRTSAVVNRILGNNPSKLEGNPRNKYIQRLALLSKQRPLTPIEEAYIKSVEVLTYFNPYLIAAVDANLGVTIEYLRHHFDTLSRETKRGLKDGNYFPLILVGSGPNGVTALGEIVRNSPELARQLLVVDKGNQPGGPFAIPGGPAWELNSANRRGEAGYFMPAFPDNNELKRIRAYGSPVDRWYPGERLPGLDIRQGSINTMVDYLPSPDDLSRIRRYPSNEELSTVIALQFAMLARQVAFNTRVIDEIPNLDPSVRGNKSVRLEIQDTDGTDREITVTTDALLLSPGLGEATYGFNLEGSRANEVLEQTKDMDIFPKISTTLEAFKAFANRSSEKKTPGRVLAIWGGGNSADTLIELVGSIFQGENSLVREVTKIYIVTEGSLSSRPRYSLINDLKPRNGRGNLIEIVKARLGDIGFASEEGNPAGRKLLLYDQNNKVLKGNTGEPIIVDAGIAATGFRPNLDKVLANVLNNRSIREDGPDAPIQPLTLPTNRAVAVAEFVREDPDILLLGTASKPRFNIEKLEQLPRESREALLRNGSENAVAIGFRAPDTQAAVNIWLNSRTVKLDAAEEQRVAEVTAVGNTKRDVSKTVPAIIVPDRVTIPNNIEAEDLLLSPLLTYNLRRSFRLGSSFSGTFKFELLFDSRRNSFDIKFAGGSLGTISEEFFARISESIMDEYFQSYALSLLRKRRGIPKLSMDISYIRGKIDPKNTYVQSI